jgi:hypothetical protein
MGGGTCVPWVGSPRYLSLPSYHGLCQLLPERSGLLRRGREGPGRPWKGRSRRHLTLLETCPEEGGLSGLASLPPCLPQTPRELHSHLCTWVLTHGASAPSQELTVAVETGLTWEKATPSPCPAHPSIPPVQCLPDLPWPSHVGSRICLAA